MAKKIMLLGSGELGKEFVIAAQRLGQTVVIVTHDESLAAPARCSRCSTAMRSPPPWPGTAPT